MLKAYDEVMRGLGNTSVEVLKVGATLVWASCNKILSSPRPVPTIDGVDPGH